MPVYSYECPKCKKRIDLWCAVDDRDKRQPCSCGASLKRRISAPQVSIFKPRFFDLGPKHGRFHASSQGELRKKLEERNLIHTGYGWTHEYEDRPERK